MAKRIIRPPIRNVGFTRDFYVRFVTLGIKLPVINKANLRTHNIEYLGSGICWFLVVTQDL